MKSERMFLLCLIIFSIILINTSALAGDIENLVLNHDFEEGINPWTLWVEDQGAGAAAEMVIDKGEHVKGKRSMQIDIQKAGKNNKRIELHQRHFVLKKGQKLTYALWAKAEDTRPAKMIANRRADPWTSYGSKNFTIGEDWQEFYTAVEMTADDDIVGIYVELRDNLKGQVWFDDFRLFEGDYVPDPELGEVDFPVDYRGKLSVTWGQIKTRD
ncbi:carbohydrate binding domain-containing protein [bacterium]|nr:carbohydrate binding domain-containing protein [bacterium]